MDKDQAKFILGSFRPDGADAGDADFTDALALVAGDRELGDWLAHEREFDAAFSAALGSVVVPENLREQILGAVAGDRGDFPQADDACDAAMIGAVASIQPPPGLRTQLLAALRHSDAVESVGAKVVRPIWKRLAVPLAAAAGVALAFLVTRGPEPEKVAGNGLLAVDVVRAGFIRTYESPIFSLDVKQDNHRDLFAYLRENSLPCPCDLPPGLEQVRGIGCRELLIDGKRGSLICFDEQENGVVHLIVFNREDVSGEVPDASRPLLAQHGDWATASWADEDDFMMLIGHTSPEKLARIF